MATYSCLLVAANVTFRRSKYLRRKLNTVLVSIVLRRKAALPWRGCATDLSRLGKTTRMTTTTPKVRSKLLGEAFVENVRSSFEFKQFCGMIRGRDSITVSVGRDVFMLNRAGLVPIDLTPLSEDEWRAKMRPMA